MGGMAGASPQGSNGFRNFSVRMSGIEDFPAPDGVRNSQSKRPSALNAVAAEADILDNLNSTSLEVSWIGRSEHVPPETPAHCL